MFQFTRFASHTYVFSVGYLSVGFPIQRSPGHRLFATYPKLIAGYHVFRRLSLPRHPAHALIHLTL